MRRSRKRGQGISAGTIFMLTFTALVLVAFGALLPTFTGNQDIRIDAGRLAVAMDESLSQLAASTGEMLQSAPTSAPAVHLFVNASQPQPTPTPAPVTPPPKVSFSLCAAGSIILNNNVQKALTDDGEYQFDILTDQMAGAMAADLSIATFENTLIESEKYSATNLPAEVLSPIRQLGVNALNIGHADALNSGLSGLSATRSAISAHGLLPFGMNATEAESRQPKLMQLNGVTAALLSYQESISSAGRKKTSEEERGFACRKLELSNVTADIAAARQAGAQVVILSVSWGKEGAAKPTEDQIALAQSMANAGADIILGTGSGVLQPVQMLTADRGDGKYHPVLCAYSLGNLMTHDREKRANLASILLKTSVVYDAASGTVAFDNLSYTPTYAWRGKEDGRTLYRILLNTGDDRPAFVDANQQGIMDRCYNLVTEIMADTAIPMAK